MLTAGDKRLINRRRKMRRYYTIRQWVGRVLSATGYLFATAAAVYVLFINL